MFSGRQRFVFCAHGDLLLDSALLRTHAGIMRRKLWGDLSSNFTLLRAGKALQYIDGDERRVPLLRGRDSATRQEHMLSLQSAGCTIVHL